MELQTLKNRVEFAIDRLGFKSVAAFERHLGWGGGSVSSLKDTLTDKRIQSLKTAFPNLNIDFDLKKVDAANRKIIDFVLYNKM